MASWIDVEIKKNILLCYETLRKRKEKEKNKGRYNMIYDEIGNER